ERMGLDTTEVLKAASTKWNFLPFKPGLVGGHCIGVDPYYLTHKAELMGYHPEVILAGRRINDSMGSHIARKTVQQMIHAGRNIKGAKVNVLGLTFKEDVPDIRNSKVIDIIRELHEFGVETFVHDPQASPDDALHEYGVRLTDWDSLPAADALILAVAHRRYLEAPTEAVVLAEHVPMGNEQPLDVAFVLGEVDDSAFDGKARYGVWRFCFGADGAQGETFAGLPEVAAAEPLTASGVKVRLAPDRPARHAYQSWSRTYPFSVARNRDQLLRKTAEFAYRALRELHRSGDGWLTRCR